mgnify:CR=1 FL=1
MKYFASILRAISVASFMMVVYSTYYEFWFTPKEMFIILCLSAIQGLISKIIRENSFISELLTILINAMSSYILAFITTILIGEELKGWSLLNFSWVWFFVFTVTFFYSYLSNRKKVEKLNKKKERIKIRYKLFLFLQLYY